MSTTEPVSSLAPVAFPNARLRELRVKIKSLAEEARIIRREERGCGKSRARCRLPEAAAKLDLARCSLREHRVGVVRRESRYSLLAYAFLRGRPFRAVEAESFVHCIDRGKLLDMAERFGRRGVSIEQVDEWLGANS